MTGNQAEAHEFTRGSERTRQGTIYGSTDTETELPHITCWVEAGERIEVLDKLNEVLDMKTVTPEAELGTVTFGSLGTQIEIEQEAIESFGY